MIELTDEMQMAFNVICETNENVFITGKAGTGKTTFLKILVEECGKNYVITAPTGIAAVNAGGVTLHSLFNIPLEPYIPESRIKDGYNKYKSEMMNELEMIIIDEVSMVRPDTLDFISKRLQQYRCNDLPFGGVQIVMFGDMYQLPPVIKEDDWKILKNYYSGNYFFHAKSMVKSGFRMFELNKVFRQTETDFVTLLNHVREYEITPEDCDMLAELRNNKAIDNFNGTAIHICSHKADTNRINKNMLGKNIEFENKATLSGDFNIKNAPCDEVLKLRCGARVMSLINKPADNVYNGSLGIISSFNNDGSITVTMDNGRNVKFTKNEWNTYKYTLVDGEIKREETGGCKQYPLILAWAITIHKSQGLTFDNIIIHSRRMFCPGQMYVALSRCRTFGGIQTESFIDSRSIIPDYELKKFMKAMHNSNNIFNNDTYNLIS